MFDEYSDARQEAAIHVPECWHLCHREEEERISVTDFELGDLRKEGAQILEWLNTSRIAVRLIALFPFQTLPEHFHRKTRTDPGKKNRSACIRHCLCYVPGEDNMTYGTVPRFQEEHYTVRHEIALNPAIPIRSNPVLSIGFRQAGMRGHVHIQQRRQRRNNVFTNPATVKGAASTISTKPARFLMPLREISIAGSCSISRTIRSSLADRSRSDSTQ